VTNLDEKTPSPASLAKPGVGESQRLGNGPSRATQADIANSRFKPKMPAELALALV
jgi:hypothetical protein